MILRAQPVLFVKEKRLNLFDEEEDTWVVNSGKLQGTMLKQITNTRWLEYAYHTMKAYKDERIAPPELFAAIKQRWLTLYSVKGADDIDELYLDTLDPDKPFDWNVGPHGRDEDE